MASSQRGYLHQACRSDNMPASTAKGCTRERKASELTGQVSPHCERDGMEHRHGHSFKSIPKVHFIGIRGQRQSLGQREETSLLVSSISLRLHPADTPTSPGLRESEMTQGSDVLLSQESADAETEGREHLEFRLFSSMKTSTGQKRARHHGLHLARSLLLCLWICRPLPDFSAPEQFLGAGDQ